MARAAAAWYAHVRLVVTEPYELTIAEASVLVRSRRLSPVELVDSLLARIDRLDGTLGAWVRVDHDGARLAARRCEAELGRSGSTGSLHGVPFGAKDTFYTAGLATEAGSKTWAGFVPAFDATTVAKLKTAGGILLGKTVTTEFADGDPVATLNPWDPACTPGGSSTGSAVAVAARMCPAALGSQTVGSVLRPAAYNGVVGLKPTFGRLSRHGVVPMAESVDHVGVFARTVEDAAILFGALAGHDPDDPISSDEPVPDVFDPLRSRKPPRIGLLRGSFFDRAAGEVWRSVEEACMRLSEAGATLVELDAGVDFALTHAANVTLQAAEAAAFHRPMFAGHEYEYGPKVRALIELGVQISPEEYDQAKRLQRWSREMVSQALEQVDVLLSPTASSLAPRDLTTTGDNSFQSPWTFTGLPSISIPTGVTSSDDGNPALPTAVQLGALPFAEGTLLRMAYWCEQALDVRLPVPPLAATE